MILVSFSFALSFKRNYFYELVIFKASCRGFFENLYIANSSFSNLKILFAEFILLWVKKPFCGITVMPESLGLNVKHLLCIPFS